MPLVFFDAIRVKIRDEGIVRNKAIHIALGVRADGAKEGLGLWLEQNEGAKFWLRVMNELRNRGTEDILLAVVDGLKGFPDAITAVFSATIADLCDPEKMPANLRAAHERNDEVLERIYIGRRFRNDTERLEKLFEMYAKMTTKVSA